MWRRVYSTLICTFFAVILYGIAESPANAGFLKNGARPGDGDRLRTVRPPRANARKRIFAPGERQTTQPQKKRRRGKQQHAWFWKSYATQMTAASSGRWQRALSTMAERRSKGDGIVSEQTLTAILADHRGEIGQAAARHNISDALILAVIVVESRGKPGAKSPKGAQGLMQLMPATAKRFGVTNAYDTGQNIKAGTEYLNWLLREFRGDPLLALAGYNAGEGAVRKHKGVPPFNETRDYVVKVMDAAAAARALCVTPPQTPRARCTWRTTVQGS